LTKRTYSICLTLKAAFPLLQTPSYSNAVFSIDSSMKISRIFVGVFDAAARQAFSKIGKFEYQ
jgi:hypothetical protein